MNDKRYFLKKHAIQKSIKDILLYLMLATAHVKGKMA